MLRHLERRAHARELLDFAPARLGIQALHVALLAHFQRRGHVHFQKVFRPDDTGSHAPQRVVRTDESGKRDDARVHEQLAHLGDAPDVLHPVRLREAQVIVDAAADIVAVQNAAKQAAPLQLALHGDGHSALARSAQAREPHHHTALPQQRFLVPARQHPVEYRINMFRLFHECLFYKSNGQNCGINNTDTTMHNRFNGKPTRTKSMNL